MTLSLVYNLMIERLYPILSKLMIGTASKILVRLWYKNKVDQYREKLNETHSLVGT